MNKAFMDQITNMLGAAQSAATSIGLAVKAEAPELCRQIVAWELWSNVACGLVWLCVLAASLCTVRSATNWWHAERVKTPKNTCEVEAATAAIVIVTDLVAGVFIIAAVISAYGALSAIIKCLAAPDLVILDYVKAAIAAVK